jgi:hypothetical protein
LNSLEGQLLLYPVHTARCSGDKLEEAHDFLLSSYFAPTPSFHSAFFTSLLFFLPSVKQVKSASPS